MSAATPVPNGVPMLSRGTHVTPLDGACVMEYVSQLAGESFTDRPSCTDPLLVEIARAVNDNTSAAVRPPLALLAPDLAAVPRLSQNQVDALAVCCARRALWVDPQAEWLALMARRTGLGARPADSDWLTAARVAITNRSQRVLIPHAVKHLVHHSRAGAERDEHLLGLLSGCLRAAERNPHTDLDRSVGPATVS